MAFPMDQTTPRASANNADFSWQHYYNNIGSRPSSRQSSYRAPSRTGSELSFTTAFTERPASSHSTSRSIARDIEHIKTLISRAQQPSSTFPAASGSPEASPSSSPPSPEGSGFPTALPDSPSHRRHHSHGNGKHIITAQLFRRNRSTSSTLTPNPHAQIFHELDCLRRRIRTEQQQALLLQQQQHQAQLHHDQRRRRPSEDDPDATSGSELESDHDDDDVPDEREEELERTREELAYARTHGEHLLEAAEKRYDALLGEKSRLEDALHMSRDMHDEAASARDDALARIAYWETYKREVVQEMDSKRAEHDQTVRAMQSAGQELKGELEDERSHATNLRRVLSANEEKYRRRVADLEKSLEQAQEELTKARADSADLDRRLTAEVTSVQTALRVKLSELEAAQLEVEVLQERADRLTSELETSQSDNHQLREDVTSKTNELETAQLRFASTQQQVHYLTRDLDNSRTELQKSEESKIAALTDLESQHKGAVDELKQTLHDDLAALRQQYDTSSAESVATHSKAIDDLTESHRLALLAAEGAYATRLQEHQAQHASALDQKRVEHDSSLSMLKESHEAALQEAQDAARQRSTELENAHHEERQRLISAHSASLAQLGADAAEAERTSAAALTAARAEHAELLQELRDAHARELQERDATHNATLTAARDEWQQKDGEKHQQHEASTAGLFLQLEDQTKAFAKLEEEHRGLVQTVEAQKSELTSTRNEHAITLSKELQDRDQELSRVKDFHAVLLEQTRKDHEQRTSEAAATHEEQMGALRQTHATAVKQLDDRLHTAQLSHDESASSLQRDHAMELDALRSQHQTELEAKTNYLRKQYTDAAAAHEVSLANLQDEHEKRLSTLNDTLRGSNDEASALAETLAKEKEQLQAEQDRKLDEAEQHWLSEMDALRAQHLEELQHFARQNDEDEAAHAKMTAEMENLQLELDNAENKLHEQQAEHERRLAALTSSVESVQAQLKDTQTQHETRLAEFTQQSESATQQMRDAHAETLRQVEDDKRKELEKMTALIQQSIEEELAAVKKTHQKQLQKTTDSHEKSLAERDAAWEGKMAALKLDHERAVSDARISTDGDAARRIDELKREHADALAAAVASAEAQATSAAQLERQTALAAAQREHKTALDAAQERARQQNESEVKKLKRRHQDAVAEVRLIATKQSQYAISELEEKHRQAIDSASRGFELAISTHETEMRDARKNVDELHAGELLRLQSDFQVKFNEVESRLVEQNARDIQTRQDGYTAELTALQGRLDATLTNQAEAERALAGLRKQGAESERRIADIKNSMETQLKTLREEKEDLAVQLAQSQAAFKELQSKVIQDSEEADEAEARTPTQDVPSPLPAVSRRTSMHAHEFTISRLEQELAAAQILAQRRLEEKSEMVRQNDFLIKELEVLLAQRSHAKTTTSQRSDAIVQTEPLISEPKVSSIAMRQIKADLQNRPKTPLSPESRLARDEIDQAWQAGSFEDYLRKAQSELQELGSVIMANEALFAQKIEEHVGDLQKAKDVLAVEYQDKFDKLSWEKERMDKFVTVKQQAAFADERRRLVAHYGADIDDPDAQNALLTSLSVGRAQALRLAEQDLVTEYSRRLAKRKSEIALKHAAEFQLLTQDFDRTMADLEKSKALGGLNAGPMSFEFDLPGSDAYTAEQRASLYGTPKTMRSQTWSRAPSQWTSADSQDDEQRQGRSRESRPRSDVNTWTSAPRTERSLPRSSTPGAGVRSETAPPLPTTGKPRATTISSQSYTYAPITQHYLIRGKTAADVFTRPKTPSHPSTSPPPVPPKTPNGGSGGPVILKPRGQGPIIPQRRSFGPGSIPQVQLTELQQTSPVPALPAPDFERQQATTIALARERMSLDRNGRTSRNSQLASPQLPHRQGSTSPAGAPSPIVATGLQRDHSQSPKSTTSSKRISIFNLKRNKSKRLSSGMIYSKPPKQQAYDLVT